MFPDSEQIITKVSDSDTHWHIMCSSSGFGLSKEYGVEPKKGDAVIVHCTNGSRVRGVTLNGTEVFYKSDEQLQKENKLSLKVSRAKKVEEYVKNKGQQDLDYASLPEIFRKRIDRFRKGNPEFRWEFESYELFSCRQAVVFANTLKTTDEIDKFRAANNKEQHKMVPGMDDGHSGNTLGIACRLAFWYLTDCGNVEKEHGAMVPLVGCEEYGCTHD